MDSTLEVDQGTTLNSTLNVSNATILASTLEVQSDASLNSALSVGGATTMDSTLDVSGAVILDDTLSVTDSTTLNSTLEVTGTTTLSSTLSVSDNTTLQQELYVIGDASFNANMYVSGNIGINTVPNSGIVLDISASNAIRLPNGQNADRPVQNGDDASYKGLIRYNAEQDQFEGFGAGNAWGSLGGIKDVDQDTYIIAETSAGTDNDQLQFYTAGTQRMIVDASGDVSFNHNVNVTGSTTLSSTLQVDLGTTLSSTLGVAEATTLSSTLSVSENTTLQQELYVTGDSSFNANVFVSGNMGINAQPNNDIVLDISASNAIRLPKGQNADRPVQNGDDASYKGLIRYNSEQDQFEGFGAGNSWGSLGGVKDIDQDTYIIAETSAGADNDELKFYTAGSERMIIDASGDVNMNSNLQVSGNTVVSVISSVKILQF